MNLLRKTNTPNPEKRLDRQAEQVANAPAELLELILNRWKRGVEAVWVGTSEHTQAMLDRIQVLTVAKGSNTAELFAESNALASYLESRDPGCTASTLALIDKAYTVNQDGSLTLTDAE